MGIDQFSFSQNFFIATATQLLTAPEPQFIYATLMKAAMRKDLMLQNGLMTGHWNNLEVAGNTSEYANLPEKGRLLLSSDLPDIFGAKIDFDGMPGSTVRINRPVFENTTYTQASREINPSNTISVVPINVGREQNDLTLKLFSGPYDSENSRPAPIALDALSLKTGVHSLEAELKMQLKRDYDATLHGFTVEMLDGAPAIYPNGMTSVNDVAYDGQFPFDLDLMMRVEEAMDIANLPTFGDGTRILVIHPTHKKQLRQDPSFRYESHDHPIFNQLFPGSYLGRIKKFQVFECNRLTTSLNTNTKTVIRAHAIAPGALGVGMGGTPRIAKASDTNYDLQAKLMWQLFGAFKLMDSRFAYVIPTSK